MYHQLVFRKLNYHRSPEFVSAIEDFVKQVVGKRFKLNPVKLLRKANERDLDHQIKEDKSFFCSELIATALKRVGLLASDVAASQYWPGYFSAENPSKAVKLQNEAYLGEEFLIDFNL